MIEDEKLINLVEQNDVLYNKLNPAYKYPGKKQATWAKIAKELNVTEAECIRRWTTLRDRFSRECRRVDSSFEASESFTMSWPLFQSMHFLTQHIIPRPTRQTPNIVCDPLLVSPLSLDAHALSNSPLPSPINLPESQSPPTTPTPTRTPSPTPPKSKVQLSAGGKKRKDNPTDDVEKEFLEVVQMYKKFCKVRESRVENAAIDGFGQMIMTTISEMSATKQAKAMQRVTEVVMALKLEPEDVPQVQKYFQQ